MVSFDGKPAKITKRRSVLPSPAQSPALTHPISPQSSKGEIETVTPRRIVPAFIFISVLILLASARTTSAQEIVLYASQAPVTVGNWTVVAAGTAAGGARLFNPDAGAAKIVTAVANPSSYAELTF